MVNVLRAFDERIRTGAGATVGTASVVDVMGGVFSGAENWLGQRHGRRTEGEE
jgi:hypothetical protein